MSCLPREHRPKSHTGLQDPSLEAFDGQRGMIGRNGRTAEWNASDGEDRYLGRLMRESIASNLRLLSYQLAISCLDPSNYWQFELALGRQKSSWVGA